MNHQHIYHRETGPRVLVSAKRKAKHETEPATDFYRQTVDGMVGTWQK